MTPAALAVSRIKSAGLLPTAESAAKRVDLRLADCLATGDITGGHIVLWKALSKAGKTPSEIAVLVGFSEPAVRDALKIRPTGTGPGVDIDALVSDAMAKAVAPLRAELDALRKSLHTLAAARAEKLATAVVEPLRAEIAALRAAALGCAAISASQDFDANAWLADRGEFGVQIGEICRRHSVSPQELLGRHGRAVRRTDRIVRARRDAVAYLTKAGCKLPDIAAILRVDRASVYHAQCHAGVASKAKRGRPRGKAGGVATDPTAAH
jgi:hypothetical protein